MHMNRCVACGGDSIDANRCQACGFSPERIDGFDAFAPAMAFAGDGFDPAQHEELARYEAANFWFRARNQLILHLLRRFRPQLSRFLEVGCGTGFVLGAVARAFPQARVVGSELFVQGLRFAAARVPGAYLLQMDARSMPYSACFDAVGAFDVIEHIEDDTRVLAELHRALVPGGFLFVSVPQHRWLWSMQDVIAHHVRRYSRRELVDKATAAGFRVRWCSSFVSLLLPMMVLARKSTSDEAAQADPGREFRIPRLLNLALYSVMYLELALIKAGIRLPIGGSLMLVAEKEPR